MMLDRIITSQLHFLSNEDSPHGYSIPSVAILIKISLDSTASSSTAYTTYQSTCKQIMFSY